MSEPAKRPARRPHRWILGEIGSSARGRTAGAECTIEASPRAGPYALAAELARRIASAAPAGATELLIRHQLTLLSVVPEFWQTLPVSPEMHRAFSFSREGNARSWTRRLAHGLTDFVLDHAAARGGAWLVSFLRVDESDPTDQEFLAVLLRRSCGTPLVLRVSTAADRLAEPMSTALRTYARLERSRRPAHERKRRPLATPDARACREDSSRFLRLAFYDAALVAARCGLQAAGSSGELQTDLTRNLLFALLLLGRFAEVEALGATCLAASEDPRLLAHVAYAKAILLARLYPPARRDYDAAAQWIERAQAWTARVAPSPTRTVNAAFLENTMALVDLRQGRHGRAVERLHEALGTLAREAPDEAAHESIILLHNLARLHSLRGEPADAVAVLTTLLEREPSNSEAALERGILHQRAGRLARARDDYSRAIEWSPPYVEPHFNRAQVWAALGDADRARLDYERVLTLDPEHLQARINRACLALDRGDLGAVRLDARHGLSRHPDHASFWCLCGLVDLAEGRLTAATRRFSGAIARDPSLADAWANRGTVRYRRSDLGGALADLNESLRLREDANARRNRARVYEALGRLPEAKADHRAARGLELESSRRRPRA
ncbi:MAG: tetratricopeptide repeat protein [Acidobacteriota bacterium]